MNKLLNDKNKYILLTSKFLYFTHCITIHSLNDFTEIINFCGKALKNLGCEDNYGQFVPSRLFYRGESRPHYGTSNVAGVYRNGYQESALYHAYMRRFYKRFKTMDDFSKLTYMQHYGLPTCLLDITSNALVALYFACSKIYQHKWKTLNGSDYRGIVYLIIPKVNTSSNKINPYIIYNNYSDTIAILSTLALLKQSTQNDLLQDFNKFNKFIKKESINAYNVFYALYINGFINNKNYKSLLYYKHFIKFIKKWKNNQINTNISHRDIVIPSGVIQVIILCHKCRIIAKKYFEMSQLYEMNNFIHKIRQNVGDFNPTINFKQILKPRIVQPALNNKRVEAQQGYFIFENHSSNKYQDKDEADQISSNLNKYFTMLRIYIPNNCKNEILNELDKNFNISKETLFPDPSTVASYMSNKFKQRAFYDKDKSNKNKKRININKSFFNSNK